MTTVFGINGNEFVLLILVAVVVVGPQRLPSYAEQLARWVRAARRVMASAKSRVDEELGQHVPDLDLKSLDPRLYDPRRIVREALLDPPEEASSLSGEQLDRFSSKARVVGSLPSDLSRLEKSRTRVAARRQRGADEVQE